MKENEENTAFATEEEKKNESPNFSVRMKSAAERKAMQDKFKKFCDENGMTSNKQLLEDMVGVYENYLFREGVPNWQPQVDDLELHLQALRILGRGLIQNTIDAKAVAMKEVSSDMEAKAETIRIQKEKIALIEKNAAEAIRAGTQAKKDAEAAIAANSAELNQLRAEHKADTATIAMLEAKESEAAAKAEAAIAAAKEKAAKEIADAKVAAEKRCVELEKEISRLQGQKDILSEQHTQTLMAAEAAKADAKAEKKKKS